MKRGIKLRRFCNFAGFEVWIVDGSQIRKEIDEEFTNFGQHYRFKFIPKNEFWIDNQTVKGEEKFYIEHMFVEHRLMKAGKSYSFAISRADLIERRERKKDFLVRHKSVFPKPKAIHDIRKKHLKKFGDKIKVWIVDGELVRDLFYIDFTEGGHDKVYSFIPDNEIWIDDDISAKERNFVLLHEAHERNLMSKGMSYNEAHNDSSRIEFYCRKHPSKLQIALKKEFNFF